MSTQREHLVKGPRTGVKNSKEVERWRKRAAGNEATEVGAEGWAEGR